MAGPEYSIADIATYPWVKGIKAGGEGNPEIKQRADVSAFPHVLAWLDRVGARPAVQRGVKVNTRPAA